MYVKGNFLRNVCIAAAVIGLICCATYASAEHIRDDLPESMKQGPKEFSSSWTGSGVAYEVKVNDNPYVQCEVIEFDDDYGLKLDHCHTPHTMRSEYYEEVQNGCPPNNVICLDRSASASTELVCACIYEPMPGSYSIFDVAATPVTNDDAIMTDFVGFSKIIDDMYNSIMGFFVFDGPMSSSYSISKMPELECVNDYDVAATPAINEDAIGTCPALDNPFRSSLPSADEWCSRDNIEPSMRQPEVQSGLMLMNAYSEKVVTSDLPELCV